MHKRIVESIKYVIENSPIKDFCEIYVKPNPTGNDGFWSMIILLQEGKNYLASHIKSISMDIGRMNGEGLGLTHEGNIIRLT